MQDCYLADTGAAEVYLAHHHDQIVVSIPEVSARENLLKQLQDAAWLFADVSGSHRRPTMTRIPATLPSPFLAIPWPFLGCVEFQG
jgi:hypothetical protein